MINAAEQPGVPCIHVMLEPESLDPKQEAFTTRLAIPGYAR